MAYGIDVEAVYYTDTSRTDVGIIDTYEIDLDLAVEKNFEIKLQEPCLIEGGYWYIENTEYGGIIDGYDTDSTESIVCYRGRSFRGMLASHVVDVPVSSGVRYMTDDITACASTLISEASLNSMFVVEKPELHSLQNQTTKCNYTIKQGVDLYSALMGMATSIGLVWLLEWRPDNRVHLIPYVQENYSDYMVYTKDNVIQFKNEKNNAVVNHYVGYGYDDESKQRRLLHVFRNADEVIQPYSTKREPIEDADYIKDKSKQVLFGTDEICHYEEVDISARENYKLVPNAPADWSTNFGQYYYRDPENPDTFNEYEAVEDAPLITLLTSQPSDWATGYSQYYTRSWDADVGDWDYSNVSADSVPDPSTAARITTQPSDWATNYGEYFYKFQTGTGYEYRNFDGESKTNMVLLATKPSDWDENRTSYYRRVSVLRASEQKTYDKMLETLEELDKDLVGFIEELDLLLAKERAQGLTDEEKRRKAELQESIRVRDMACQTVIMRVFHTTEPVLEGKSVYQKILTTEKKINDFLKKLTPSDYKIEWRSVEEGDAWVENLYYRQDSYTVTPAFADPYTGVKECYRLLNMEVVPTWQTGTYYSMLERWKAPNFVVGDVYEIVLDYYADIAESAVAFFESEVPLNKQTFTMEDLFESRIGDIVGGKDEFMGQTKIDQVTNIVVTIENGIVLCDYEIGGETNGNNNR